MAAINPAKLTQALAQALDGAAPLVLAADLAPRALPQQACLVLGTSGSTAGKPQIVAISRSAIQAAVSATHEALGGAGSWLLTLPADHVAGVMVAARAHLAQMPLTRTTPGPFRPETFAADVERFLADGAARHYTSLVPTQLSRVLADPSAAGAASRLDAILVGGSATPSGMLRQAREAGLRVVTTYGMTETCGGCVYDGMPLAGIDVTLAPDSGRLTIAGPQVALGYLVEGELQPFDGTFVTADRGEWIGERLRVLGRLDDVILSGGINVDPRLVEEAIASLGPVAHCLVVGLPDVEWGNRVAALVVPHGEVADAARSGLAELVQQTVRERLGAAWMPRQVLLTGELPLRGPGKPDRVAAVHLLGAAPSPPQRD